MLPLITVGEFGTKRIYLKKQMNRFHQTSTIAFKGGKVLLSLLVGVEVCEAVLDGVGEDKLLQVHHLERKKLVILM